MLDKYNEICNQTTWLIKPTNTPLVIRYCNKCNKKKEFYCSEKFRVNSNGAKSDIWLIYKCSKCDTTLNLTIKRGIKPSDFPVGIFEKFTNNDAALAWKYAFDRNFLKQQNCVVQYDGITYTVDGTELLGMTGDIWFNLENPLIIHIKNQYIFDLKLSTFLAGVIGISAGDLRKYVADERITVIPHCDVMKYRIKADIDVVIHPACPSKSLSAE